MQQTALVLQGGGALGAYEYGALKRFSEDRAFFPDVVSGVSIGAINAAVLVGAPEPLVALQEIWDKFAVNAWPFWPGGLERIAALWGNANFYQMRLDYLNAPWWSSFYHLEPLRELLQGVIDFERLNRSRTHLIITAVNIHTGQLEIFDNRQTAITMDHILGSAGLPPGFPMTEIQGQCYWDGGLFNNTPLAPVIECLNPDPQVHKRIIVVGLFPTMGKIPQNMPEVFDRIYEIIFSSKLHFDVRTLGRINEYVDAIQAIDQILPSDSPIRQLPGYRRLNQYMLIKDLVLIENQDPELVTGPFDFSRETLEKRILAGYRDADQKIRELQDPADLS